MIDGLKFHPKVAPVIERPIRELLWAAQISNSSRFHESLPSNSQSVDWVDSTYILMLRRVLRNENAEDYHPTTLKKMYEAAVDALGLYSSDSLTRNLRTNPGLVKVLKECDAPYSLLGKYRIINTENPDKVIIVTRPLLIVPGTKNLDRIIEWENANTIVEQEVPGLVLPHMKRVKAKENYIF